MGLTQKEAATRVGVDPSTLDRWERGERERTGAFAVSAKSLSRITSRSMPIQDGAHCVSTNDERRPDRNSRHYALLAVC
jgi:transcriptional regulator with XRE-family HTH domain